MSSSYALRNNSLIESLEPLLRCRYIWTDNTAHISVTFLPSLSIGESQILLKEQ